MNVDILGKSYPVGALISDGGEGEIFELNYNGQLKCIKVYYPDKRSPYIERKLIALANRFEAIDLGVINDYIAYPELPIFESDTGQFCGFLMKYFPANKRLIEYSYSKNTGKFGESEMSEEDAIKIVDNLYYMLRLLHRIGFIVGDLNPENILIGENLIPKLVDIDSFQIGTYYSNSRRKDYFDPSVKIDGYGKAKYFIYSTDSDIYSLAIIAYELLVGSKPHFYQTETPIDVNYKKEKDISILDYFVGNKGKYQILNTPIFKDELYYSTIERLDFLEKNFFEIFAFLKAIFTEGKRYYFYYKEKREINIRRKKGILSLKTVELLPQSKEDPVELDLFLHQYQITLP